MINGRRTKNNSGIVHKNAIDNVNRDLDDQNFDGEGKSGRKHLTGCGQQSSAIPEALAEIDYFSLSHGVIERP